MGGEFFWRKFRWRQPGPDVRRREVPSPEGAGLVMTEATRVERNPGIMHGWPGLYFDAMKRRGGPFYIQI